MKRLLAPLLATASLLLAALPASATDAPLPRDSVYQLQAELTDHTGRTRAWRDLHGKPRVVSMFYTSCQYICPLIVDSGKAIEKRLGDAERKGFGIVLVSMDPAHDTPAELTKVIDQHRLDPARWTLATPPADQVRAIAGVLDIRYRALADGEFNHTSALVLLDADGRVLARTAQVGTVPDPEFVAAVKQALR